MDYSLKLYSNESIDWVTQMTNESSEVKVNAQAQFAVASYNNVKTQSGVEDASPHKLIEMLFEGLIERISQAKGAMQHGNVELKGKKINGAINILGGLRESLDTDNGGDLAENLNALYIYVQKILSQAHMGNDSSKLDEAGILISDIYSAWKQIG